MTTTTKTYSVVETGPRDCPEIVCRFYENDELVRSERWGRNAVGAHFDALSQGYAYGSAADYQPRAYTEALARFNG